jgi:cytochrome P450
MPGPRGLTGLRLLGLARENPLDFLAYCQRRYGPMVSFEVPRTRIALVNRPDAVRRILQGNHLGYGKRTPQYRSLSLLTGEGIVVSEGEPWKQMRRLLAPSFHARMLTDVVRFVDDAADRLVTRWERLGEGDVVDVDEAMMRTTLEVIGRTLFGADLADVAGATVAAVSSALDDVVRRAQALPVPLWLPTPANRRFVGNLRQIDAAVAAMIAARRANPDGEGLLASLLAAQDAGLVTPRQVRDEAVTLVVAGHETVAAAATWTMAHLADSPDALAAVVAEGRALPAAPVVAALPDLLPWTRAAVDEALRLWPPVWLLTRRALADDVLGGYQVPRGTMVIVALPLLHRDPDGFADPEAFEPCRFLEPARSEIPRDAYLPFGAGPRLCIGRDLSLVEVPLLVARVLARFDVRPVGPLKARPGATIRPDGGLPARVVAR